MKRIKLLVSTTILMLITGCGNEAPNKPSIRVVSAGAQGSLNEFDFFVSRVDGIDVSDSESAEYFPALILQSQMRLLSVNLGSSDTNRNQEQGRCLLFNSSQDIFIDSDIESESIRISPGGRLAYSEESNLGSADCHEFFRDGMSTRFQQDFFQLYSSFFSFDFD